MTQAVLCKIRDMRNTPVLFLTVVSLLLPISLWGQTQGGSLGDIARQVRASKDSQSQAETGLAQHDADELSEDQNDTAAPAGFRTYKTGDYNLWIPTPYSAVAHDSAGLVLSAPLSDQQKLMFLLGSPVTVNGQTEAAFQEAATRFVRSYSPAAACGRSSSGNHVTYKCDLSAGHLSGQRVGGIALLIAGGDNLYPVFCVNTVDSRPTSKPATASSPASPEDDLLRDVQTKCDTVFQSIHLNQDVAPAPALAASANPEKTSQTVDKLATSTAQNSGAIPDGSKVARFQYCSRPLQCWDASVLVPAEAQLVSSACKQSIYSAKVQATEFLLMAGPAEAQCSGAASSSADLIRWKQLVDPEAKRAPGTYSLISSQTTQMAGKPAVITTLSFRKGLDDWMGKRIEIESNGVPLVVGCMAPREHFADGDALCSALIGSLQLP